MWTVRILHTNDCDKCCVKDCDSPCELHCVLNKEVECIDCKYDKTEGE